MGKCKRAISRVGKDFQVGKGRKYEGGIDIEWKGFRGGRQKTSEASLLAGRGYE